MSVASDSARFNCQLSLTDMARDVGGTIYRIARDTFTTRNLLLGVAVYIMSSINISSRFSAVLASLGVPGQLAAAAGIAISVAAVAAADDELRNV